MSKVFPFLEKLNNINLSKMPSLNVGSTLSILKEVLKGREDSVIEVVTNEKDFSGIGCKVISALKDENYSVKSLILEEKPVYHTLKSTFASDVSVVIAIGDYELLSTIRYCASLCKIDCIAIPTKPYIENLLKDTVTLKTDKLPATIKVLPFFKVIIDVGLISKSSNVNFLEAYLSGMSKLVSLIDYKINCFLSSEIVNGEIFSSIKNAVNVCATAMAYQNYKEAILFSQLQLLSVKASSSVLDGLSVDSVETLLTVFAPELSTCQKKWIAFEKTAKIYHMYFSNDFSTLLSVPDFESDLIYLEEVTHKDRVYFSKNLKIPSERRRELINLLTEKLSSGLKSETTLILSLFNSIKTTYKKLDSAFVKKQTASYKQIKNSVVLAPYLSDKVHVLTLCRDAGILKCAN